MQTLADAAKLLELMEAVGQRSTDSGGRGTPNYSSGIRHVKKMVEEIEKHRTRVGKLAEAQKLQTEQFKQLHSCEKDAQEVHLAFFACCKKFAIDIYLLKCYTLKIYHLH